MADERAIYGVSLVVVGQFNPAIFQPKWFATEDLIRAEENERAKIEVIHPEISSFALGGDLDSPLKIQVTRSRFIASTEDARRFELLRDLVVGALGVLRHTPTSKVGINYEGHVPRGSAESLNLLGDRLAPKEPWAGIVEGPGLLTLTMKGARNDALPGFTTVTVEPSNRIKSGVFVRVNDHYDAEGADGAETDGTDRVHELISTRWDASIARSRQIVDRLGAIQ